MEQKALTTASRRAWGLIRSPFRARGPLQGGAICLPARILAVANTFCALMRPRSYRRRHDEPAALAILRERPFKYDQQVVDALAAFLQSAQGKEFVQTLQQ